MPGINYYDGSQFRGVSALEQSDGQTAPAYRWDGSQWVKIYPTLPGSAIYRFVPTDIGASDGQTVSTWPERIANDDMAMAGSPSYQTDVLGTSGDVVRGDGVDDYGQTSTMGSFGSDMTTDFAIAVAFSTSSRGRCATVNEAGTIIGFGNDRIGASTAGTFAFLARDAEGDRISAETSFATDDGGDYVFIINKTGNTAADIAIYDSATNDVSVTGVSEAFDNPANFNHPMTYFAQNSFGSVGNFWNVDLGQIIWFDTSLSQNERQQVFDSY